MEAIAQFVKEHQDWAIKYIRRRGATPQQAEDLVQALWVEMVQRPPKGLQTHAPKAVIATKLKSWLIRDWYKQRRVVPDSGVQLLSKENLSSIARCIRLFNEVRAAMERLQTSHREALRLRYLEGLSSPQVAAQLSISDSAVRGLVRRALVALRSELHLYTNTLDRPT
ncbi:RNA polymerase sigma factor [Plesiocystis pacifica]|uniref:RNA polymerase sigma factor n=1 Tax=Plesiocystis pacifica TaxID=191768 RepID=UPI003B82D09E